MAVWNDMTVNSKKHLQVQKNVEALTFTVKSKQMTHILGMLAVHSPLVEAVK